MILMAYKTQFGHASFTNLYKHGIFTHGASGFFMSFQMALFSFVGIEMIGVTAGETKASSENNSKSYQCCTVKNFSILRWCISSNYVYYSLG